MFRDVMRSIGLSISDRVSKTEKIATATSGPLQLRLGAFVEVDPLPLRALGDDIQFGMESFAQPVAARGLIDLSDSHLHRFYFDDGETWLQIKTDGGSADADISECILWCFWETLTPANQSELQGIAGPQSLIGLPTYALGKKNYQRAWGVSEGQTELVPFREQVFGSDNDTAGYECEHLAMLYRREVADSTRQEYVLISVEETSDGIRVVTSVGIDISPADLSIT